LLPRPITTTRAGDDELAFDTHQGTAISEKEKAKEKEETWLSKKKPARFRLASSGGTAAAAGVRKRVARASLVYLQPRIGVSAGLGVDRRRSDGWVGGVGYGEGNSDDELSLL
jgi:hypothetical protein